MKILSLFDGISVAQQALKELGVAVDKYYASETDKYAIVITRKNFPNTIQLGDVREVSMQKYPQISHPDLLILGSPCQDLSIAKKNREGLNGKRSGLFWEAIRIHKEVKPKWFLYENVSSMKKEWKQQMLEAIQEIEPSAYMIEINAALVSAQNRKRVFFTNIPHIEQPKDKGIFLRDILEEKVDEKYYVQAKSNTVRTSGRGSGIDNKHNWDSIRIGTMNKGGQADRIYSPDGKSVTLSALGGGGGAKTGLYIIQTPRGFNKGGKRALDGKTPTLSSLSWEQNNKLSDGEIIRKLTPLECERLQSLPDNFTARGITENGEIDISNAQRYKALGNAFNCEVVKHILHGIKRIK